jgi:hypothetical protein
MSDMTANHVGQNTRDFKSCSSCSKTQEHVDGLTRFWYPWDSVAEPRRTMPNLPCIGTVVPSSGEPYLWRPILYEPASGCSEPKFTEVPYVWHLVPVGLPSIYPAAMDTE